jgi:hypothetical protein
MTVTNLTPTSAGTLSPVLSIITSIQQLPPSAGGPLCTLLPASYLPVLPGAHLSWNFLPHLPSSEFQLQPYLTHSAPGRRSASV